MCGISESSPATYAKCFDPAFQDTATALTVAERYAGRTGFIHSNSDTSGRDTCSEQVPVGDFYSTWKQTLSVGQNLSHPQQTAKFSQKNQFLKSVYFSPAMGALCCYLRHGQVTGVHVSLGCGEFEIKPRWREVFWWLWVPGMPAEITVCPDTARVWESIIGAACER